MKKILLFSVVAVMFVTFCYKVAGYVLIFGWSSISGINMNFYNPVAAFVYSFLPQLLLNTVTAIPLIVLIRFLGPVSFRNTKRKDDVISDSGEGTWLGI